MVYQLLVEFLGAFFGFLFAILLTELSEKSSRKKRIRIMLNSLANELQDIVIPLKKYVDNKVVLSARIAIPTWDALQHSGMTLELLEKDYFDSLVAAYAVIKAYNEDRLYNREISVNRMAEILAACEHALSQIEEDGERR